MPLLALAALLSSLPHACGDVGCGPVARVELAPLGSFEDKEEDTEEEEEEGEEEEEEDEAEVQEAGGEPPLGHDEIEGLRTDLGKRVKSAKRLELAFKRLDMDGSGGLCKPEFKRLIVIGAGKNDRFLNDKSRAQLWEAAWNGQPHGPDKELPLEVLQEWIFLANGAPQKIDD